MSKRRLKERRTVIIRMYALIGVLFLLLLLGGVVYGLWRPEVRVASVSVSGAEAVDLRTIAQKTKEAISGSFLYILPKDSIFLLPVESIRGSVLSSFPRIKTVAVERTGFSSIEVLVSERRGVFAWCTNATSTPCVMGDSNGFLFAPADAGLLPVYGKLLHDAPPIKNVVFKEDAFPKVASLIQALTTLDIAVLEVRFNDPDEVSLILANGVRVEYVLGEEASIAEALPSVLSGIESLEELEYIDMRFGKRVYIKRNE